ncbi:hypothetical protein [Variovorax sp. UC74_104]|uniref:hypothetical protein n=1 Tax=Variovorax sp. UC74_104 TaxID=3374555 RepID=UPI00375732B3
MTTRFAFAEIKARRSGKRLGVLALLAVDQPPANTQKISSTDSARDRQQLTGWTNLDLDRVKYDQGDPVRPCFRINLGPFFAQNRAPGDAQGLPVFSRRRSASTGYRAEKSQDRSHALLISIQK